MRNYSGFGGYPAAALYPNMGDGINQTMQTIPDPEEIEALTGIEPDKKVSPSVTKESKRGIWLALGVVALFVILFGIPKGA